MGANLITLDEFKLSEKLTKLDDDDRIESLIASCSQLVKTYCGNSFVDYVDQDMVETVNVEWDTHIIQLEESPVISVSLVEERPQYSSDYVTLDSAAFEYYVNVAADIVYRTTGSGYTYWAKGPGAVRITYRAGYVTVPDDLKLAVVDLVNYYFKDEYKPRRTIGGSSMSNDPSSTQWRNVSFPDHIKRVLDLYKLVQV